MWQGGEGVADTLVEYFYMELYDTILRLSG